MKKWISLIAFCAVVLCTIPGVNEVLVEKGYNRYYMLEKELQRRDETYDVQIYGSCHAYTSYNPMYLIEDYGISAYNMSNPGEIIPSTYLRMKEQFEDYVPKVALVEIWGVNPYETYDSTESILGEYFTCNIERLPLSKEKLEVIFDFNELKIIEDNVAMVRYKNRLLSLDLTEADFDYSFEKADTIYNTTGEYNWLYHEMKVRFSYNGYLWLLSTGVASDYVQQQAYVDPSEKLAVEPIIMKYVDKIIELCDEYGVELIFYRAPYRSTENELRKVNYLKEYFAEKQVPFFDLEERIEYDHVNDFYDFEHLAEGGADKSTEFLNRYVLDALGIEPLKEGE